MPTREELLRNPASRRGLNLQQLKQGGLTDLEASTVIAGFDQPFGEGRAKTFRTSRPGSVGGGVDPIGFVEPLNQFERQTINRIMGGIPDSGFLGQVQGALGGLQQQATQAAGFLPQAQGFLSQLGQITPQQVSGAISQFQDPFTQQVIDPALADLQDQARRERTLLSERFGANRGFGSSAEGIALGEIGRGVTREAGRLSGGLRSQGFQQSVANALNLLGQQRAGAAQGAQLAGQLGLSGTGALGDLARLGIAGEAAERERFLSQAQAQLGAGGLVRGINQARLDVLRPEIARRIDFPTTQLSNLANIVSPIATGSSQGPIAGQPTLGAQIGGTLMTLGSGFGPGGFDIGTLFDRNFARPLTSVVRGGTSI